MQLLQYAFSDSIPSNGTTSFIKKIASLYGPEIPHSAIRHACLAIAARILPPNGSEERSATYKCRALGALRGKLNNPADLNDADMFAALLVAQLAIMENRPGVEMMHHLQGCMAMLLFLSEKSAGSVPEEMLQYFDLLVLDVADYVERLTALQCMSSLYHLAFDGQSSF